MGGKDSVALPERIAGIDVMETATPKRRILTCQWPRCMEWGPLLMSRFPNRAGGESGTRGRWLPGVVLSRNQGPTCRMGATSCIAAQLARFIELRKGALWVRVLGFSSFLAFPFSIFLCVKILERFVELQPTVHPKSRSLARSLAHSLAVYSLSRPNSQIPLFLGLHYCMYLFLSLGLWSLFFDYKSLWMLTEPSLSYWSFLG